MTTTWTRSGLPTGGYAAAEEHGRSQAGPLRAYREFRYPKAWIALLDFPLEKMTPSKFHEWLDTPAARLAPAPPGGCVEMRAGLPGACEAIAGTERRQSDILRRCERARTSPTKHTFFSKSGARRAGTPPDLTGASPQAIEHTLPKSYSSGSTIPGKTDHGSGRAAREGGWPKSGPRSQRNPREVQRTASLRSNAAGPRRLIPIARAPDISAESPSRRGPEKRMRKWDFLTFPHSAFLWHPAEKHFRPIRPMIAGRFSFPVPAPSGVNQFRSFDPSRFVTPLSDERQTIPAGFIRKSAGTSHGTRKIN